MRIDRLIRMPVDNNIVLPLILKTLDFEALAVAMMPSPPRSKPWQ
jgi:hypothetical protein